jgi:HEAT repeat protein
MDERAAPLFVHLVQHLDRRAFHGIYVGAIDALGSYGAPEAVAALKAALHQGDVLAPLKTRRSRAAAARALRRIGTSAAIDALRDAAARGSRGVRAAAKAEIGNL